MHRSASDKIFALLEGYLGEFRGKSLRILEVGSQVVEKTQYDLRAAIEAQGWSYTGLDIEAGPNVDVAVADPYDWQEIESGAYDAIICNQVFEHVGYPWVTMYEIARVLKERGVAFIIAPSAGPEHRYPTDCWRTYPDGWRTLCQYAGMVPVEVYTQWKPLFYTDGSDKWQDSCVVAQKPVLTPDERQSFAVKIALQKQLLKPMAQWSQTPPPSISDSAPSAIPLLSDRQVLTAYAKARAKGAWPYPLRYKRRAVTNHLRKMLRELFSFASI